MSDDKKYNGWTNYETWAVNLWFDDSWSETAQEIYNEAEAERSFTKEERATLTLTDRIKDEVEEMQPDLGASIWSDLLSAAMSEVNWYEIAKHYIAEVDQ